MNKLSEVRVYNRALSSNEVAALYAMESTPPAPPTTTVTFGSGTNQFGIDFVTIGNPGNSNDTTGYGGVPYSYRIGKYTISQNQIDAATRNGLQNVTAGAWSGDQPAANISWYEAAAYVNWLNTNQGYRPAYNLTYTNGTWSMALWPTSPDTNGNVAWTLGGTNLFRNANCTYFLPSENEWYKAAYYDPNKNGGIGGYWSYTSGSDMAPKPVASGTATGTAVYNQPWGNGPAAIYQAGGLSSYGTMGQVGNIWQWNETTWTLSYNNPQEARLIRGGGWYDISGTLQSSYRKFTVYTDNFDYGIGFRVASVDDSWLTNGLVAYYPFEGDAKDASGNGNDGIVQGATLAPDRFGSQSSTYLFDGNSSIDLTALNKYELGKPTGQITTSFWFLATGNGPILGDYMGSPNSGDDVFTLLISVDKNLLSVSRRHYPAHLLDYTLYVSTNPITDGRWHHCITVADGSGALRVNLDGVNVANLLYDSNLDDVKDSKWQAGYVLFKGENQFFHGKLDDVRIYNRALSSNEVAQLYAYESIPPAPTPTPTSTHQTISFLSIAPVTYGVPPFTLTASASSGLPVSFSSSSTNISIAGSTITVSETGTATIVASQTGDATNAAATPVTNSLVVNGPGAGLKTQTITFPPLKPKSWTNASFALTAKASSKLPITYTSSDSSVATLSNGILTPIGVGTTTITAYQAGNTIYNPAPPISQPQVITQAIQKISFPAIAAHTYGDAPFTLAAQSTSGLPVTYSSSASNVATVSGNVVSIIGAGTAKITATQAGNTLYTSAAPVSQTLKVAKANQTVTFNPSTPLNYTNGGIINFNGTAASGLTLNYASSKPKVITIVNGLPQGLMQGRGTTTITATQSGNANYNKASAANSITLQ